jgi:hypothetical protein
VIANQQYKRLSKASLKATSLKNKFKNNKTIKKNAANFVDMPQRSVRSFKGSSTMQGSI